MSVFSGRQSKGAMKRHRDLRKMQAAERDALSEHRREGRQFRRGLDRRTYDDFGRRWDR